MAETAERVRAGRCGGAARGAGLGQRQVRRALGASKGGRGAVSSPRGPLRPVCGKRSAAGGLSTGSRARVASRGPREVWVGPPRTGRAGGIGVCERPAPYSWGGVPGRSPGVGGLRPLGYSRTPGAPLSRLGCAVGSGRGRSAGALRRRSGRAAATCCCARHGAG